MAAGLRTLLDDLGGVFLSLLNTVSPLYHPYLRVGHRTSSRVWIPAEFCADYFIVRSCQLSIPSPLLFAHVAGCFVAHHNG